jgi:hypothetical protein
MVNKLEESIVVAVVFGRKPYVKPVWFVWRKQHYRIQKITYSWMDREGRAKCYHFAVSDGANLYELCYNSEALSWQLLAVGMEG